MKRIFLAITLLVLIISLVSCAKTVEEEKQEAVEGKVEQIEQARQEQVDRYAELDSAVEEAKEKLKSNLKAGIKTAVSKSFDRANVGDIKFVIVGIRNDFNREYNFNSNVDFKEAYDSMRNRIETDKKKMNEWKSIKNVYTETIKSTETGFITIYFEVRDEIKEGISPKKGSYVFDLGMVYEEKPGIFQPYGGEKTFTIQIQ